MASYHLSVKVGAKGKALPHASYIAREGDYKTRQGEELEATEHGNMPEWAQQYPSVFWRCADEYERKNGSTYREIEIALPRELTPEQRKDLVKEFVDQELGNHHAYTWAIHTPKASIEGGEQPHAHIMYSERIQDGIQRSPDQFFKRYNSKNPDRGGCQKSNTAKTTEQRKNELVALRERFASLQNRHLEKYGHESRVDHRSNEARGISHAPERHLGWKQAKSPHFKALILEYRESVGVLNQHTKFLPKHLARLDQEQVQQQPKPLTDAQKWEAINQKISEAKQTTIEYNDLLKKYRIQHIDNFVQQELKTYQTQATKIRGRIDELDQNKPMLFGKKEWEQKRESLVDQHETIKQQYDRTKTSKKTELGHDLRFGRQKAIEQIKKNHPKLSQDNAKAQEFIDAVTQLKRQQEIQQRAQQKANIKEQSRSPRR